LKRLKECLERHGVTWEINRRRQFRPASQIRRAKRFQKRFKARKATYLAQVAGEQPALTTLHQAQEEFWKRTGKP
jgi:hypothetical protein